MPRQTRQVLPPWTCVSPPRRSRRAALASGLAVLAGCSVVTPTDDGGGDPPTATGGERQGSDGEQSGANGDPDDVEWRPADGSPLDATVTATRAAVDLEVPWDLAFAGDDAFVTERTGGLLRFETADLLEGEGLTPTDADRLLAGEDLPRRRGPGEGGTLGVAVHPDYPDPHAVYIYYTANDGRLRNRVVRYDLDEGELSPVLDDVPAARIHNGGRLEVGPEDRLWVLTGDADDPSLVQDPSTRAGATLRITPEGDPAPDNPDFGEDADPRTYTLGHRNPQGLAFAPDGLALLTEHGPSARDEVSVLRPGANYGWNVARGGPDDPQYDSYSDHEAFTPPVVNAGPDETWAPSGAAFYAAAAVEAWHNRLFVAGLRSETLFAITLVPVDDAARLPEDGRRFDADWLDDRFVATVHPLLESEFGRLRHAAVGPEGALYLLTSNRDGRARGEFPRPRDDLIVRLEPV